VIAPAIPSRPEPSSIRSPGRSKSSLLASKLECDSRGPRDSYTLPGEDLFTRVIDRRSRSLGRDTGWELGISGANLPEHQASYGYNATTGFLETVAGGVAPDTASHEAMRGMPRKQQALLDAMFEIIANDLVPHRPDREEPRAKKRRPKNYHLLTQPRHELKIPGHRNRPNLPQVSAIH
jgi:hypothetical protein